MKSNTYYSIHSNCEPNLQGEIYFHIKMYLKLKNNLSVWKIISIKLRTDFKMAYVSKSNFFRLKSCETKPSE